MLTEIEPDVRDEPITEPPKKWRNKWLALAKGYSRDISNGTIVWLNEGDVVWGALIHPTKEIAEQRAKDAQDADIARGVIPLVFIGAFPVDDE